MYLACHWNLFWILYKSAWEMEEQAEDVEHVC